MQLAISINRVTFIVMRPLSHIRDGWEAIEAEETRLLREMSAAESLRHFLELQQDFAGWLDETEPLFREGRNQAMIQLQARLASIDQYRRPTMDTLIDALFELQTLLEREGLPSILIGGLAVGIWGEPRLTRDIDVKVLVSREERGKVLSVLSGYTPLNADPDQALRQNGIAFFLAPSEIRVDIMLADTIFDEVAIGRAQTIELDPKKPVRVCSAEDLIIYKSLSLRARDYADVESIVKRQGDALDDVYVEKWLREFELALDESELVRNYRRLRGRSSTKRH